MWQLLFNGAELFHLNDMSRVFGYAGIALSVWLFTEHYTSLHYVNIYADRMRKDLV